MSPPPPDPHPLSHRLRSLKVQRICAWSGIVFIVTMAIGFVGIAGFIPPPHPGDSEQETARFFIEDRDSIRFGLILSVFSAGLLVPFSTGIAMQMKRIEGRFPSLAAIQLSCGVLLSLEFIYLIFFWQTATFRTDRMPELIELLNDMAWIPYIGLSVTVTMQAAALGIVALMDRRENPIFPRWFGYYSIWAALFFSPGTFNVFFQDGPMAWDGIIAFYLPIAVYVTWIITTPIMLLKAINHQEAEEAALAAETTAGEPDDEPTVRELAAEVARLRAELQEARSNGGLAKAPST